MTTLSPSPSPRFGPDVDRQPLVRVTDRIDRRWAENYACSVFDTSSDLLGEAATCVHPGYLSYPQWLARQKIRQHPIFRDATRIIQLDEHCVLTEPLQPGQTLDVQAIILDVAEARAGADVTVLFEYFDATDGRPLGSTSATSRYWGISVDRARSVMPENGARTVPSIDVPDSNTAMTRVGAVQSASVELFFPPYACHVYSELARIWTAFHTDLAAARQTGYDGLILHGTGVLSWVLSELGRTAVRMDGITRFSAEYRRPLFIDRSYVLSWDMRNVGDTAVHVDYALCDGDERVVAHGQIAAAPRLSGASAGAPLDDADLAREGKAS